MSKYSKLSKEELEELARKYGVELDRRLLKSKMVKQLEKHISSLSKDELEELAKIAELAYRKCKTAGGRHTS